MTAVGALALAVLGYAGLLAVWAAGAAVLRRPRGPAHSVGLAVLELMLLVQAVLRGVGMLDGGPAPVEPAVHLGYLGASVLLLPLLLALTRPAGHATRADAAWYSATVAVACVAVAVVDVRLMATGPPHP